MGRKKEFPVYEQVLITDIGAEGKAIARVNDMVIFIAHAVPGDIADIRVTKKRRSYMEGVVVKFHTLSDQRCQPVCSHFGICGGCKWQDLPYDLQLHYKEKQVSDQLIRIGHLEVPSVHPILPSELQYEYRNKLEFTFSDSGWLTREEMQNPDIEASCALGFHIPGFFDKVLDIQHCHLQGPLSNAIRLEVKDFAKKNDISFFNLKDHQGLLRTLIVRTSSSGECMVILTLFYEDQEIREKILNHLIEKFPEITSLMYVINSKPHDSFADLPAVCYHGKDHMIEEMEHLRFKVGPKSFYQTNSKQAYRLYSVARRMAGLKGGECVYDLYTGTGTIANFIADKCSKVVGIEYVEEAIEDAKINSELNGIKNTVFFAGDMKDILTESFIEREGRPDVLILDPPRAGVHPKVIGSILYAAPSVIVYVSCNPATQARDLALLKQNYRITEVQPVDMFPQTHHVESVVRLEKLLLDLS